MKMATKYRALFGIPHISSYANSRTKTAFKKINQTGAKPNDDVAQEHDSS
jgi:hypothetical protein